jgi:hypothetical protein
MRIRVSLALAATGLAAGCAAPAGNPPSLAPRAAEAIDPRVPIPNEVIIGPADATLSAHLTALVDQAQAGDSAFAVAAAEAERLALAAGTSQSESWVVAQQALSVAQSARAPTTRALGDIDEIAATALEQQGGLPPGNLAAIKAAASTVSAIDNRQSARIEAIENRLGL